MQGTFGQRLKQARAAIGLSQQGLAVKGGFHTQTVSDWERGLLKPLTDSTRRLAEALAVEFMWLAFGEGEGPAAAAPTADDEAGAV